MAVVTAIVCTNEDFLRCRCGRRNPTRQRQCLTLTGFDLRALRATRHPHPTVKPQTLEPDVLGKRWKKAGMVNSQMGVEESLANPANLVRLRITLRIVLTGIVPSQKIKSSSLALAGVGSGRRFFLTLSTSRGIFFFRFFSNGKSS